MLLLLISILSTNVDKEVIDSGENLKNYCQLWRWI